MMMTNGIAAAAQSEMFAPLRAFGQIATDPMIEAAARNGAVFVFNLSGGKDCGAAAAVTNVYLDSLGHPRHLRVAIHADLGRAEWAFTPAQVEAQAHALGVKLIVVRAGSGDLVDRFENRMALGLEAYADMRLYNLRGPWSSPALKFCQSEKKIQVMGPHLARAFAGRTIVNVVGIRREESPARAKCEVAKADVRFAKPGNRAGTTMLLYHPIVDVLTDEVFALNVAHGIPLAPTYGMGSSRHSCALCVMGSANDLSVGAEGHPWLYQHYVGMEVSSTFSFQHQRWLADVAPHLLTPGMLRDVAAAKIRAAERRRLELALPAQHRYVSGWPLHIPTYDEAVQILETRNVILGHHGIASPYDTVSKVIDRFAEMKAAGDASRAKVAA